MKLWMKLAGTALLAGTAAVCAAAAIGGIASAAEPKQTAAADFAYVPSCSLAEAEYVLREYDGCVAVFASAVDKDPITLTDIEIETLRTQTGRSSTPGSPWRTGRNCSLCWRISAHETVFRPFVRKIRLIY